MSTSTTENTNVDAQSLFNQATLGVWKQARCSTDAAGGTCFYRGPNNVKCAVGHVIPDRLYDPRMEGNTVYLVLRLDLSPGLAYLKPFTAFLDALQMSHDAMNAQITGPAFQSHWLEEVKAVAREFGPKFGFVFNPDLYGDHAQ